jgi:hypothetical protein
VVEGSLSEHDYRSRIRQQALNVVRLYLAGRLLDQPATREQKELIENVVATDYDGRTVIELLQNAHDAHPRDRRDGRIRVLLRTDDGPYGTLYVANGGEPFQRKDFDSICQLALSSKPPAAGIGNKGVGFKSVLQLSLEPEVYSSSSPDSACFDGFCFRFAQPGDFDDLANAVEPDEPQLADELRENVSPLKVPLAIKDVPDEVARFADAGFVTVVRLRMRSVEALRRARAEIDALVDSSVPFHLFLERVKSIDFLTESAEADAEDRYLERSSAPVGVVGDLVTEHVRLEDESEFVLLHVAVPESLMRSAIEASRAEGRLGASWERWEGDGKVSVAMPLGEPLTNGRLFTFLPMAETAPVPLRGFVNGPFFAHLNRRDLEVGVPLNSVLFDELARACAAAIVLGPESALGLSGDHLVDLLTWTPPFLDRLDAAFEARDTSASEQRCIPALGERVDHTALVDCWSWGGSGNVLSPSRVDAVCGAEFLSPALDATRIDALVTFAEKQGRGLVPDDDAIAMWAEMVARSLLDGGDAARRNSPGLLVDFPHPGGRVKVSGRLLW